MRGGRTPPTHTHLLSFSTGEAEQLPQMINGELEARWLFLQSLPPVK